MQPIHFTQMLRAYTAVLISGNSLPAEAVSQVLIMLLTLEAKEGGPYTTGTEGEIDFGMNLAIALFLSAHEITLPNLSAYIDDCLNKNRATSECVSDEELAADIQEYRRHAPIRSESLIGSHKSQLLAEPMHAIADSHEERLFQNIYHTAHNYFAHTNPEFNRGANFMIRRVLNGSLGKQIALMSLYVRDALAERGEKVVDEFVIQLGVANTFFWAASLVYDDFWDEDEGANPALLPVANAFMRQYVDRFSTLLPEKGLREYFHSLMGQLENANAWEIENCRTKVEGELLAIPVKLPEYGDYRMKFYPASGHCLGPVAVMLSCEYEIESKETQALIGYMREYLIAMQLNDDAHDWKEDLERGHLSTAVVELLSAWKIQHPESNEINLVDDMPELEELFWFTVLEPLCEKILAHSARSRGNLSSIGFAGNIETLEKYIKRNENAAHKALAEIELSKSLLNAMSYPQVRGILSKT